MDKKNKAEKELRELHYNKAYLCSLEEELNLLDYQYGLRGISYDGAGGSSGTSDTTGNQATVLADERIALHHKINRYNSKIAHIEQVLNLLTSREYTVVNMYYIKYKPWWRIAQEIGYSKRQAQRIKDDAIEKIAIGLYGSDD